MADIYKMITIAAHRAYDRGLQAGTGGNISVRKSASSMIVKAAGGALGDCTEAGDGWVESDFEGNMLSSKEGRPTKEWLLHAELYKNFSHIGAIVHTHSVYTISWAHSHDEIPLQTWQSRLKLDGPVPVVNISSPVVTKDSIGAILTLVKERPDLKGFVLKDHGLVALGKDPLEAENNAELIEETAKIAVLEQLIAGE